MSQKSHEPISIANAERYSWGDGCAGWHFVRDPSLSVIQERMPPGTREVRHYHRNSRQFFFVLRGELEIDVAGVTHHLVDESGLEIAPGVIHEVRNSGSGDAEFLVISQPPSHGDRIPAPAG
jgi:mannose-6-phosphate isomerase-like protein (cupin superfamily)